MTTRTRKTNPPRTHRNYLALPPVVLNLDRPEHQAILEALIERGHYRPGQKRKPVGYGRLVRRLLARYLGVPRSSARRPEPGQENDTGATDDLAAAYACRDWNVRSQEEG